MVIIYILKSFSIDGNMAQRAAVFIFDIIIIMFSAKAVCMIRKFDFQKIFDTWLAALPAGIAGGRMYYVICYTKSRSLSVIDMFNISKGGLSISGIMIGSFIGAYLYSIYKKSDFLEILDISAPSIVIMDIIFKFIGAPVIINVFILFLLIIIHLLFYKKGWAFLTYGIILVLFSLV